MSKTITDMENRLSRGRAFRQAREGDTYIDSVGKHWLCHGTQTGAAKPSPYSGKIHENEVFGASTERDWSKNATRTQSSLAAQMQNLPKWSGTLRELFQQAENSSWRAERGIPAGVSIKYETSYTKKVIDQVMSDFPTHGKAAADLLKDYHASLHAPYEQRDKARQDLVVAEAQRDQARSELKLLKGRFARRCKYLGERLIRYSKGE